MDREQAPADDVPVIQVEEFGAGNPAFAPIAAEPISDWRTPLTDAEKDTLRQVNESLTAKEQARRATTAAETPRALAVRAEDVPALRIEEVARQLAACRDVDEVKEIRDRAVAFLAYHRERGAALDLQNTAAEIRLRAERELGARLKDMPKNQGGRPRTGCAEDGDETCDPEIQVSQPATLDEIGISRAQSSVWQRIADLPAEDFEDRIAEAKENGLELTTGRLLRGKPPSATQRTDAADGFFGLQKAWGDATEAERRKFMEWVADRPFAKR